MKITVAMRVFGGFSIITLLLLIISIFSLVNLNQIQTATEEVNNLAMPTLNGSNKLKISFVNMGKLTFEAFYEAEPSQLASQQENFKTSQTTFESELGKLRSIINSQTGQKGEMSKEEAGVKSSLAKVEQIYQDYGDNVNKMFEHRKADLDIGNSIKSKLGDIEDNADDTSTLIVDFADSSGVKKNNNLKKASEIASTLETNLMSLLTASAEYIKSTTLTKAETLGNEVKLLAKQVGERNDEVIAAANDQDSSGTIDEINELVTTVMESVSSNSGLLQSQINRLNHQIEANQALKDSEQNIQQGVEQLEVLLGLANSTANSAKEDVADSVSSGTSKTIFIAIVSVIIAAGIAYFSVRAITVPLQKVNEMLNIVSSGDLTRRLDDSSDDEFGVLAKNCNNLIDSLKSLITGISSRAAQLAAASEQTSAVTAQTTKSIQEQKSQVGQVAAATAEMHSTSQVVAQSAEDTLNQIRDADAEAEKVKLISLENKRTIEVLARDVEQAGDVINKLHQDSASIGGILDVIRGVADQTNLLALNAAIEAARAGEQGRGFAVVADEVRTLASRTQQSTQEINAMIEVLQAGAEKAVAVMNQGKEQTTLCVAQTEKATQALDLITDAVHRAFDVSTQIEQSAREQNVVSQEISEKLENIVGIAEETAIGAQQTADSSHEVAKLAEELQSSIKQFRV
jgi:methyl-accepting chemotaxis protein